MKKTRLNKKQKINLNFRRFEFKYLIPQNIADRMIPELLLYMDWDPYVIKSDFYSVYSIYYDSPSFKNYYEKLGGLKVRSKQRLRFYYSDLHKNKYIFFEIKNKISDIIIKERTGLLLNDYLEFINNPDVLLSVDNLNPSAAQSFFYDINRFSMKPVVAVVYKRKPLVGKDNPNFRVTFDYDIKATYPDLLNPDFSNAIPVADNIVVFEVKYNGKLPRYFFEILNQYKLKRASFSKYCQSIPLCYNMLDVDEIII